MGLEAISRGYSSVELEISPKTGAIIKNNYKNLKLTPNLIICDCLKYQTDEKYDVIYADPPWDMDYKPIILKASKLLADNGVIILPKSFRNKFQNLEEIRLKGYEIEGFKYFPDRPSFVEQALQELQ